MKRPSPRETQILEFIEFFKATHADRAPTLTEIGTALNLNKNTIHVYIRRMIEKGYVARQYGVERGLTILYQE